MRSDKSPAKAALLLPEGSQRGADLTQSRPNRLLLCVRSRTPCKSMLFRVARETTSRKVEGTSRKVEATSRNGPKRLSRTPIAHGRQLTGLVAKRCSNPDHWPPSPVIRHDLVRFYPSARRARCRCPLMDSATRQADARSASPPSAPTALAPRVETWWWPCEEATGGGCCQQGHSRPYGLMGPP